MPWYLFALATPTFYSISNFIDKFLIDKKLKEPIAITTLASIVSGLIGIVIGLVVGFSNIGFFQTAVIMFAGILLTLYSLPYYEAMKIEDVSRVVPLYQFIPVFTLILSSFILKETLTIRQICGLLLVVIAGVSISVDKLEGNIFKPRKSLWYMLISCLMYGSIGIIFRFVVKEANFWTTLSYEYIGSGLGGIFLFLVPKVRKSIVKQRKQIKQSAGIICVNNGFAILAQVSESFAVSLVAVPLVNLIGSIQPLFSLAEGFVLTKKFPNIIQEDISKNIITRKLISICLIFCGLYLVYFN